MLLRALRALPNEHCLLCRRVVLSWGSWTLSCKLYHAVVKPVLSYGCEVWGPLVSDSSLEELKRVHLSFLRRILDVPRATAAKHLYAETGRLPHKIFWWQQSLKYMHHLTSVDPSQFVHKAFRTDHAQELGWGQAVLAHLFPMGFTLPAPGDDFNPETGCTAIAAAVETALMTPTLGNNLDRVYYSFKPEFGMEAYLTQLHRGPLRTTLARFRLGHHWLQTRLGRFGPHWVPCESRWCQHCALVNQQMVVDSEEHALFDSPSTMTCGNSSHGPNNSHATCRLSWRRLHCSRQAFSKLATIGT